MLRLIKIASQTLDTALNRLILNQLVGVRSVKVVDEVEISETESFPSQLRLRPKSAHYCIAAGGEILRGTGL
jgi:hypothetical protein